MIYCLQVIVALTKTARLLNTPGANFRGTWPNTQVSVQLCYKTKVCAAMQNTGFTLFWWFPVSFTCGVCEKVYDKAGALRRHKRIHASHKPVLLCPRANCQAYFTTTFNLEHHIRKVHLQLLKYKCFFPDCPRSFVMRVSMWQNDFDWNVKRFEWFLNLCRRACIDTWFIMIQVP